MNYQERDQKHLWHPLTQHGLNPQHTAITKAEGVYLYDDQGKRYIDGIASWYTCMYGHCNPTIVEAVHQQMQTLDHVVFTGFTHPAAIELSEALIDLLPNNQEKLFFSDNGSTSVDVALKMAFQYFYNQGQVRKKVIALENGFHGDTFGAMSASGLSVYNGAFESFFISVERIPVPTTDNLSQVLAQVKSLLEGGEVASFVYEPLVQGAAAMQMYEAAPMDEVLALLKEYGVLLIADEVMTGFGKTGRPFASEYIATQPDLICLSKALTAGMLPMAITSCTQHVYDAFLDSDITKGFFHGHTYSANPVACSAALAGIRLYQSEEIQANIKQIEAKHQAFVEQLKSFENVKNARTLGVIVAFELDVEMERYGDLRNQLYRFCMDRGLCARPLGNTLYLLPPYVITEQELDQAYNVLIELIKAF